MSDDHGPGLIDRRDFMRGAVALGASWVLIPRVASAARRLPRGVWLAGDLHCHTFYSSDVWNGPLSGESLARAERAGFAPADQIRLAELRGLDFLAITDHNTVGHLRDPGFRSDGLVLIPGYEHSLSFGHAGLLGVRRHYRADTSDRAGVLRLMRAVHRAGGIMIINHPRAASRKLRWRYSSAVRPDAVEVWNGLWPNDAVLPTVGWWDRRFLRTGRMPAIGGSDSHRAANAAQTGVGQPTTWVYARNRSRAAILAAIRAGRTTVSAQPPVLGGPRLSLVADSGRDRWMVGEAFPRGRTVIARVRAVGAYSQLARLVVDGVAKPWRQVEDLDVTFSWRVRPRRSVRAELALPDEETISALTSPIYAV